MGKKNEQQQTPQEAALAQRGMAALANYKRTWEPLQVHMGKVIRESFLPDSAQRQQATGAAASETGIKFDQAQEKAATDMENRGIGAGSSAFRLAQAGIGTDRARATAGAETNADQSINQAYVTGLTNLMRIGQGKEAMSNNGLAQEAQNAARAAQTDAAISSANRAGNARLAGSVAGYGIGSLGSGAGGGTSTTTGIATPAGAGPSGISDVRAQQMGAY